VSDHAGGDYCEYWGLAEAPFRNTADVRYYFPARGHDRVLDRLLFAARQGLGLALLTGTFGCGKSLLARMVLNNVAGSPLHGIFFANAPIDELGFYVALLTRLGVEDALHADLSNTQLGLLQLAVHEELDRRFEAGARTVIIIDDAHLVSDEGVFRAMKGLLNYQMNGRFVATVIAVGQEGLDESIRSRGDLERKVELRTSVGLLSPEETSSYVFHRLKIAGSTRELFTDGSLRAVFDLTGGLPFAVNRFCELALLAGAAAGCSVVDEGLIEDIRDEALGHAG